MNEKEKKDQVQGQCGCGCQYPPKKETEVVKPADQESK